MELTVQDHEIFKNYINNCMQKNMPIELLIDPIKCYHCSIITDDNNKIDKNIYLNNLTILLNYLIQNNLFIDTWKINSKFDIFTNNFGYRILDQLYIYFAKFVKPGRILYNSNFLSLQSQDNIDNMEIYLNKFLSINVPICLSYQVNFDNVNNLNNKLLQFLSNYNFKIYAIINNNLNNSIENYKSWIQIYNQYYYNSNYSFPIFKIDKTVNWTEEDIKDFLILLKFIIDDRYRLCDYDIEKFTQHLFFSPEFLKENNILYHNRFEDILSIIHYNKYENNNTNCSLEKWLFINLKDLSFPVCNGLTQNYYCGGKLLASNELIACESINGYFSQRSVNNFFLPDCFGCKNKFFCNQGCRAAQADYHLEPFLPIENICKLLNDSLDLLIKQYHQMGVFDYLFTQKKVDLTKVFKYDLILLLKAKGYTEYEYRYS